LPIFNGFWSKEMILAAGLRGGSAWLYALMLFGAGLTALYTFRCVWMVFFAPPFQENRHMPDAGPAMRAALYPLAAGVLTTWLLVGPFSRLLEATLPDHGVHAETALEMVTHVPAQPQTWLAVAVVLAGLAAWWQREKLALFAEPLQDVGALAANSFGFEAINQYITRWVNSSAEELRGLQTGQLNWNVAGIIAGLVVVLMIVALGA
jgi:NADH-quinone oxidoreductase subunit L